MTRPVRSAYVPSEPPSRAELALDDAEIAERRRRDRHRRWTSYASPGEAADAIMTEIEERPREDGTVDVAPQRSLEQRRSALKVANRVRSGRAEIKRELRAGRASIHELLDHPPEELAEATIEDVLLTIPKFGPVKVDKLLTRNAISAHRRLARLTPRQREVLHRLLENTR